MIKVKKLLLSTLLTVAAAVGFSATANAALPGFYLGGQAGWGNTHYSSSDITNASSASVDSTGVAGRLFGGYQFNPNGAFELGYTQFSKTKFTNIQPGGFSASIKEYAVDAVGKGILPLNNGFALTGDLGLAYVHARASSNGGAASDHRINPTFGVGASYDVTANVPVFIAWNRIQKWGGDIPSTDLFSLGVAYNFG